MIICFNDRVKPFQKPCPVIFSVEKNRNLSLHFSSLYKGSHFKKLIERSKSSREENICLRCIRKHHFPRIKMMKIHAFSHVWIQLLFRGKRNVKPYGNAASTCRTFICSLHNSGSTTCDYCESFFGKPFSQFY